VDTYSGTYNLIEEPWIPVLYHDGRTERVGIWNALENAHEIRQIAASNPMDRASILRFMLALLYWCKGNPSEDMDNSSIHAFPMEWFEKLRENKELFNLLGEGKRFYQTADISKTEKQTVNYLIHEIPTGTNMWHFRHSNDGATGLCPACCAMGLIRLPLFTTMGGSGYTPGINNSPPVYAIPLGRSIFDTLLYSYVPINNSNLGSPAWETPIDHPPTGDVPFLLGLTWSPRKVWLDIPETPDYCFLCGNHTPLIRRFLYAGFGGSADPENAKRKWIDPWIVTENDKAIKSSNPIKYLNASVGQEMKFIAALMKLSPRAWG
jgi:CRISPR type I-E-associated protein CasA/Cse1